MHDPQVLLAFDRDTLEALVRTRNDADRLIELIEPLSCRRASPSKRKVIDRRIARLRDLGAPDILVEAEQFEADPKSFILERLQAGRVDSFDLEDLALLACKKRLFVGDLYLDLEWLNWPNRDSFSADIPVEKGLVTAEQHRQPPRPAPVPVEQMKIVMWGSSNLSIDDVGVFDSQRHHWDDAPPDWNLNWHDADGVSETLQSLETLYGAEPPADPTDALYAHEVLRTLSMCSEPEHFAAFRDAELRWTYHQLIVNTVKLVRKLLRFYRNCKRRRWHVLCPSRV